MNSLIQLSIPSRVIVPVLMCAAVVQFGFSTGTSVLSTVPANNALHVSASTTITATFSGEMNAASFNDTTGFMVIGSVSGRHRGSIVLSGGNTIATFTPDEPFTAGERVEVALTSVLLNASLAALQPRVLSFTVKFSEAVGTFSFHRSYSTGDSPLGIDVGDMDGDGYGDVVVTNTWTTGVSTFRNLANGYFDSKVDYQTGSVGNGSTYAFSAVVADLNGDGAGDLVVGNCNSTKLSVLMNNGDGTFAARVDYSAGAPSDVSATDLDGDGDIDIAMADKGSTAARVYLNNGDGTLAAGVAYTAGSTTSGMVTSDIDNDGDQDMITANEGTTTLSVFKNNGNGTFAAKVDLTGLSYPLSVDAQDINGDGFTDLVCGNQGASRVSVFLNDSTGGFGSVTNYTTTAATYGAVFGDIDGDGDQDIVVAVGSGTVSTFPNNGDGTFGTRVDLSTSSSQMRLIVADLDRNGVADIAASTSGAAKMSVFRGMGLRDAEILSLTDNTSSGGTLNGNVNVNGESSVVRFLIGTTSGMYTDSVTATQSPVSGSSVQSVSAPISGLTSSTTYYVRLAVTGPDWYLTSHELSFSTQSPDSIPGFAVTFDGSNDYIEVPYNAALNPAQFTVELWARVDGGAGTWRAPIASRGSVGSNLYGYNMYAGTTNRWSAWIGRGTTTWCALDGGAVTIGDWTHLAMTHDGTNFRFYVNGVLTGDTVISFSANTTKPLRIGSISDALNFFFNGKIDEVRIWNTARSAQAIRETMHRVITDSMANLVANWHFAEGNGTTATESEEGRSGTLTNFDVFDPYRWTASTIPAGPVSAGSVSSFTSGTTSLGTVSLTTGDAFDNAVDLTAAEIGVAPNSVSGISGTVLNDRYWTIDNFGTPGTFAANLTFTVPATFTDNGTVTASNYTLYHRSGNSDGAWSALVAGAAALTSTTITFNGITSFSQFAIGTDDALPAELVSLNVEYRTQHVEVHWKTATEVNNVGFEIEKKKMKDEVGGMKWERIGFVEGSGTTNAPKEYSFIDRNLQAGTYSYRLKQIDRGGKFSYSQEVEVSVGSVPKVFALEQNYPNPFNPATTIGFTIQVSGFTTLKIYDAIGREVATLVNEVLESGVYHQRTFDASNFASGVYFARLQNGENVQMKKMSFLK